MPGPALESIEHSIPTTPCFPSVFSAPSCQWYTMLRQTPACTVARIVTALFVYLVARCVPALLALVRLVLDAMRHYGQGFIAPSKAPDHQSKQSALSSSRMSLSFDLPADPLALSSPPHNSVLCYNVVCSRISTGSEVHLYTPI
jgi:hypothetical protein